MRDRYVPPNKLAYGPLAVLDWLCEAGRDARMVSIHRLNSGRGVSEFLEVAPSAKRGLSRTFPFSDPGLLDRLGGRDVTDLRTLDGYALDWFQRQSAESSAARGLPGAGNPGRIEAGRFAGIMERHGREAFGYTDTVYMPSDRTMELWHEAVREEAARRREQRAEREASVRRLVVIAAPWSPVRQPPKELAARLPPGFVFPLRGAPEIRPYAVVEVRRETAGRLYLSRVERLPADGGHFRDDPVTGREPNVYVDSGAVLVDGITRADALRLSEAYAEDARSRRAADERLMEAIVGPLSEWTSAQAQRDAERDDVVNEILGRSGSAPKP